jgi:copper chaperone CopZ
MKMAAVLLFVFSANIGLAEVGTFKIEGMTCGGCVKMIKAGVCDKLSEVADKCEVKVGSMEITTKAGKNLDIKQIEQLISATGEYKMKSSEIKK